MRRVGARPEARLVGGRRYVFIYYTRATANGTEVCACSDIIRDRDAQSGRSVMASGGGMDSGSDRSSHSGGSPGAVDARIGGGGGDPGLKSPADSPVSLTRPSLSPPVAPPVVSTPSSMAPRCLPLPPPGLGLLNTLGGMVHHNPLDLMAVAHHHAPPRSYNSPPPISTSDPTANECKLVEYRGQKVAAFIIAGDTMLCLPQAFELFLKHLVGGLHTVYTKLKRLDIVPLVCNVEQVRILRGLGAIQPGVNRCKLLSCKDFDVLYRDCTTARYVTSDYYLAYLFLTYC